MCGIVCYVGPKSCTEMIYDGLKRLEYRGYDSAGVAVHNGDSIGIVRAEGKLNQLRAGLEQEPLPGSTGIGHTRWATHGRPSETNAHPHFVDGVAVVHNGIFENHLELRLELKQAGAAFSSETDTEIMAHLVAGELKKGVDPLNAVRHSLARVHGSYAIAVIFEKDPGKIVVAKNASPLVIGIGEGETYAASDIPALLPHTNKMLFLDEEEIALLTADGPQIETLSGERVAREAKTIGWSPVQAEKSGYKHFMLKEIFEQPRAIEDTLRGRVHLETGDVEAELIGLDQTAAKRIRRVVLLACGTSYHAALVGRYWIEALAQVPAEVELASEYRARGPLVDPNDLVVAVSQSGETVDTLEAVKVARAHSAQVLAVANVLDSAIPRAADGALYTHAGPEIGVASTKCFTAQLAALFMLAVYLGKKRQTLSTERARELLQGLVEIPHQMHQALGQAEKIAKLAHKYAQADDFLFLGRGLSYPIAIEGALKLKEISYIHAEGYAAGEMKHGPIALIDEKLPVVVVMPSDEHLSRIMGNVQEVLARDGQVIAVVTDGSETPSIEGVETIVIPRTINELSPLVSIIPMQLLAYHIADFKGTDVDQPRNLAKTVTVE